MPQFHLLGWGDELWLAKTRPGPGLKQVPTALRLPWQNAYAERFIGSLRRACLDHVIALNATHVRRILAD